MKLTKVAPALGGKDSYYPIGWNLEGFLVDPIKEEDYLKFFYTTKNGHPQGGIYVTTPVMEYKNGYVTTENSIYLLEK